MVVLIYVLLSNPKIQVKKHLQTLHQETRIILMHQVLLTSQEQVAVQVLLPRIQAMLLLRILQEILSILPIIHLLREVQWELEDPFLNLVRRMEAQMTLVRYL